MINRLLLYVSIVILSLWNLSFNWPVQKSVLTSTYCESRADHFHDGIDIVGSDDAIYASTPGKLVFMWDKSLFPDEFYPGGGNYKILTSGTIFSIYMHLQDGSETKRDYSEKDVVGFIGNSGHSFASHLHFSILERDSRSSRNPLTLLPQYNDTRAPEIEGIYVRIDDSYFNIRNKSKFRLTKHYPLLIKITDTVSGKEKLGIYSLRVTINNADALKVNFDNLAYTERGLAVNGMVFDDLFDEAGYYKLKNIVYSQGQNIIQITARDYEGNETVKLFDFDVKLDIAQ